MPDTNEVPVVQKSALETAKDKLFGVDPVLGPDGEPLEKGHGSAWASMKPAAKAHYQALVAAEDIAAVESLAKQLAAACTKFAASHKLALETIDAAAKAPPLTAAPSDEMIAKIKADGVSEYKAQVAKELADQAERDKQGKLRIEAAEKAEKDRIALKAAEAERVKAEADLAAANVAKTPAPQPFLKEGHVTAEPMPLRP